MTTKEKSPIFLSLPFTEPDSYSQKILSGLGKATRRGIKKCFNCGVYNGTRSSMCKNKECGAILKDSEEKPKADLDAVRLLTGTERQVYSVRVKDAGINSRGFVQLPLLQNEKETNIFSEVALCFVDSCQNSFDNSILKCHEEDQNDNNLLCDHIRSALKSQRTAAPVELKNHVFHHLKVTEDVKAKLYLLAMEKEGALVQRVSKSVMAVKCQVTPKHPLGYLHFTFIKRREGYENYYCSCTEFIVFGLENDIPNNIQYKCVHYYACIWALASDPRYSDEFSQFVNNELPRAQKVAPPIINLTPPTNIEEKRRRIIKNHNTEKNDAGKLVGQKRKFKRLKKSYTLKRCKRLMPKILPVEIKVLSDLRESTQEVSWSFVDWLTYVTESINRTMQFDNCGILNTLVFNIPEKFYECFKKRVPNIYEEIQTGVSFTHHIMNILRLKEIFDTPQIKLKISKKFVHSEQKGYVEYDENEDSTSYQCPFIFFLNVGQSTVDESDNTNNSFIIEWLPSFSNLTQIGQLKLQYKYGRKST